VIAHVPEASVADDAVARAAFASWSGTPVTARVRLPRALRDELVVRHDEISETITAENGCSPLDREQDPIYAPGDRGRRIRRSPREVRVRGTQRRHPDRARTCRRRRSDHTLELPAAPDHEQVGSRAGRRLHHRDQTQRTHPAQRVPAQRCLRCGRYPEGVGNLVPGYGRGVGEALAGHPGIDVFSFTGSVANGTRVAELAARNVTRVTLELGGKSSNIILDDADLAVAVKVGVTNAFLNSGQTCTAWTLMLVPAQRYEEAVELAAQIADKYAVGDPADGKTKLGAVASKAQRDKVRGLIQTAVAEGARVAAGGAESPDGIPTGYNVRPTILADVKPDSTIAQEEVFGPVLSMLCYEDEDDAVAIANNSVYGLHSGVWSADDARASVARRIRTGSWTSTARNTIPWLPSADTRSTASAGKWEPPVSSGFSGSNRSGYCDVPGRPSGTRRRARVRQDPADRERCRGGRRDRARKPGIRLAVRRDSDDTARRAHQAKPGSVRHRVVGRDAAGRHALPGRGGYGQADLPDLAHRRSRSAVLGSEHLEYMPIRARDVAAHLRSRVDVTIVRVTPPDSRGVCSLGPSASYTKAMLETTRLRTAEIDPNLPRTFCADVRYDYADSDLVVDVQTPTSTYSSGHYSEEAAAIADQLVPLIQHGATLQLGIGTVTEAVAISLAKSDLADLRIAGMMTDAMVDLAVTGRLAFGPNAIQAAELIGSSKVFDFAHENDTVQMHSSTVIHDGTWLAAKPDLVSVCSALAVDLTGQVASEQIGARLISGVGGSAGFFDGAHQSEGGIRIVALTAKAPSGNSRFCRLFLSGTAVTLPRHSVDYVATEFGIAHLTGLSLSERAAAWRAVAAPGFREMLAEPAETPYWRHEGKSTDEQHNPQRRGARDRRRSRAGHARESRHPQRAQPGAGIGHAGRAAAGVRLALGQRDRAARQG